MKTAVFDMIDKLHRCQLSDGVRTVLGTGMTMGEAVTMADQSLRRMRRQHERMQRGAVREGR